MQHVTFIVDSRGTLLEVVQLPCESVVRRLREVGVPHSTQRRGALAVPEVTVYRQARESAVRPYAR